MMELLSLWRVLVSNLRPGFKLEGVFLKNAYYFAVLLLYILLIVHVLRTEVLVKKENGSA